MLTYETAIILKDSVLTGVPDTTLLGRCVSVTGLSTYGLRRVCVWVVSRVETSVSSQHGIEHSVTANHAMIWRRKGEERALM